MNAVNAVEWGWAAPAGGSLEAEADNDDTSKPMITKTLTVPPHNAPADSRKGANPQSSQAARRSLPALAKVRERVVRLRDKARILRDHAANGMHYQCAHGASVKVLALNAVVEIIDEVWDEEPEGNTERTHGGTTDE